MFNFTKRQRGAVSVFLVIILVPCMLVASIFIDVGRVYLSKSMAESSADLALNTLMTQYDFDLNDWYGMVASCQDIEQFYDISEEYYVRALKSQKLSDDEITLLVDQFRAIINTDEDISDYLRVTETSEAKISVPEKADLTNSTLVKSEIVDFMKYRAPVIVVEDVVDRLKNAKGMKRFKEADENEKLVENHQKFIEADETLRRDSYRTYKYLNTGYSSANPEPKNDVLKKDLSDIEKYAKSYETMTQLLVTNLYNTSDLNRFYRPEKTIDSATHQSSESGCHSRKVDGVYYIDGTTWTDGVKAVEDAIKDFDNATRALGDAVKNGVSYTVNQTNDVQYWRHAVDIMFGKKGGTNYYNAVKNAANTMMDAYGKLVAMESCEDGENLPDDMDDKFGNLTEEVIRRQNNELKVGANNNSTYTTVMKRVEDISTNNIDKITANMLTLTNGRCVADEISHISSDLKQKREYLQKLYDVLEIVIKGNKGLKIVSLDTLKKEAENYDKKLDDWSNQADGTNTDMAGEDREEIRGIRGAEDAKFAMEVNAEAVNTLKTRLLNIQKQLKIVIDQIDNVKYGNKKLLDITNYDKFKTAASTVIKENEIYSRLLNDELKSYATTSYKALFTYGQENIATINETDTSYNLELNPETKSVETPTLYVFWHDKFHGANENAISTYDDDKAAAGKAGDDEAEAAKDATVNTNAEDIVSDIDTLNKYANLGDFTVGGLVGIIKTLIDGNPSAIRDNLYMSSYIMHMFSYQTYENEGKYRLLKESGYEMDSLTSSTYKQAYADKNEEWASTDYRNSYNKSLTNKMIAPANCKAYECEVEHVLFGESNKSNLKTANGTIYIIRYALNLVSAFQHFWKPGSVTGNTFQTIGAAVQSATMGIVPASAVKLVLILLITVFETCCDMSRLKAGFPVEIYKDKKDDWQRSLEVCGGAGGISGVITKIKNLVTLGFKNVDQVGLFYSDYMWLFVITGMQSSKSESMCLRIAEVIENNMQKLTNQSDYKLANAKCYFTLDSELRVDPMMITLPIFNGWNSDYDRESTDWCTYQIKTVRGY